MNKTWTPFLPRYPNSLLLRTHLDQTTEGEIPLVTNENRKQYVKDYIAQFAGRFVHRQPKTFVSGFLTTIDRRSLMVCHDPPPS